MQKLRQILSWLVASIVGLASLIFAIVNRDTVSVNLWPFPWRLDAPVFVLVLLTLAIGFLVGWVTARLGDWTLRHRVKQQAAIIARLEQAELVRRATLATDKPPLPLP